jgi:hypothetical protein
MFKPNYSIPAIFNLKSVFNTIKDAELEPSGSKRFILGSILIIEILSLISYS